MALNKYKITPVTRRGHGIAGQKQCMGSEKIRPTKAEIRGELGVKRQTFDVYNMTRKKFVDH
jgi:hypothetical protein